MKVDMKADMTPLPDTYQGGEAFWARMEVRPKGFIQPWCGDRWFDEAQRDYVKPPYAVGDTLYLREEWEHTDPAMIKRFGLSQPAFTMPEWAARKRFTVTGVEAGRVSDIPNGLISMRTISGSAYTRDEWGWLVTLEDVT